MLQLLDGLIDSLLESPVLLGLTVVMLLFVFFVYLFLRRTVTGFKQGLDQGRNQ